MKNLLVSFSGGETSGFMAQWIKDHLDDMYDEIVFVFANTGLENEQTLEFVKKCDEHFNLNVNGLKHVFTIMKEKELGIIQLILKRQVERVNHLKKL